MIFTALDRRGLDAPDVPASSEMAAAKAVLPVLAARLAWSAALGCRVAYLPARLWREAPGASVQAIRGYYGTDVLVAPDSVWLP